MTRINFLCDQIAHHSADKNVRRKMLPAAHAGITDRASQAIRQYLRQRTRIFMREYSRHRPGRRRVFGRERRSALKKRAAAVALERALAPQRVFQALDHHEAVNAASPARNPLSLQWLSWRTW